MTDLYRFYDAADRLLYVGISLHAAQRASQHRHDKQWWPDVSRMDIEHLDADRSEAERIERDAIRDEHPLYNKTWNTNNNASSRASEIEVVEFNASWIPESTFNAISETIDALGRMLDRQERQGVDVPTRADFIAAIDGITRSVVYGDMCTRCGETRHPIGVIHRGGEMIANYRCCGELWPCGWTSDLKLLAELR